MFRINTSQFTEIHQRLTRLWHGQPPGAEKLRLVTEQRQVLARCLEALPTARGGPRFFPSRACKLYNEPTTKPQLYEPGK